MIADAIGRSQHPVVSGRWRDPWTPEKFESWELATVWRIFVLHHPDAFGDCRAWMLTELTRDLAVAKSCTIQYSKTSGTIYLNFILGIPRFKGVGRAS